MLATLADYFQAQGKVVYVVGISFGAFMVQELPATKSLDTFGSQALIVPHAALL